MHLLLSLDDIVGECVKAGAGKSLSFVNLIKATVYDRGKGLVKSGQLVTIMLLEHALDTYW
jgi:hypothetical protein